MLIGANVWARQTFASLRHPNFRLWFVGQLVSLVGTWTQSAALGYLVYELTLSPAYLGYVNFAAGAPAWFITLWAGIIADRMSRRKLMILIQSSMMAPAIILAVLTFTNRILPWHILVLAAISGIAIAFDGPVRQAFVPELIEREDLTNAIALNAMMFNIAVMLGPAIGGMLYAWIGPGWCFTINAISFLAVILALAMMRISNPAPVARRHVTRQDMAAGLIFVLKNRDVLVLILSIGLIAMFGIGLLALMPAWSVEVLHGGPQTNGLILSARGFGAIVASILVASLGHTHYRRRMWATGTLLLPVMLLLFSFMRLLPLSLLMMVGVGMGFMLAANTGNAMVQLQLPDELRGRVMSVYIFVFFGSFPLGSLLAGQMAEFLGEPATMTINGAFLLLYSLILLLRFPRLSKLE
jgi:MFS family permease